jgi:hypothetical protein
MLTPKNKMEYNQSPLENKKKQARKIVAVNMATLGITGERQLTFKDNFPNRWLNFSKLLI